MLDDMLLAQFLGLLQMSMSSLSKSPMLGYILLRKPPLDKIFIALLGTQQFWRQAMIKLQ
jgi:hypothetical protein